MFLPSFDASHPFDSWRGYAMEAQRERPTKVENDFEDKSSELYLLAYLGLRVHERWY
ncbi:hypothetical protein ES319_A04G082800v1 [Gossypium barbadense]|uniref:Uncharacterized protein n=2 Tax=Gossypium TaxID=3633 RepID=A0A5J5W5Z6_GOSBA|nr:hypothetical protein ES319_A04G082800v1 [Gossypium barbadense]TYH22025.1 hypothetical protein ES288_A04G093500v1 [Gossypium darwinii]